MAHAFDPAAIPSDAREVLDLFHPAVRTWFERAFPEGPSEPQRAGWPVIRQGGDALIAAPTGTGKTLTGFLTAIDDLYRRHEAGEAIAGHTQVVYVSPLKALAVDIHHNLTDPLEGIAQIAEELGYDPAPISHAVRTGDTLPSERQAMVKNPPNILVTTPESLYLYVTAERSRATLAHVETVIVDEIHAMARDKRGSHMAVTLERLDAAVTARPRRPTRIGLSATVKPLEVVAHFLTGDGDPSIVDVGHRRPLDVSLEMPDGELEAALSGDQRAQIVQRIAEHVAEHRTTLVFVNTRKMSERIAHELGDLVGDDQVAAHHGSLSRERRQRVEDRLRKGDLKALVATASLELGIDVGPVELVCQFGSPRNIGVFLQRVGRANHHRSGVPKGILFPTTRDELVESAALLSAIRAGRLDALHPPDKPLDILAQQVVAEVAARGDDGIAEADLLALIRRAAPYESLTDEEFDEVVTLVAEGIETGRGRRMAYLHRDQVHGHLKARRGARLAALTSGGAIPESGDYRVLMEPGDLFVGTVNEDFAIESMQGDVFLLGSHPWQIVQVTNGVMRVRDATGKHPTVPFWLGEAPGRTLELSEEVSTLRTLVADQLADVSDGAAGDTRRNAIDAVLDAAGLRGSEHGEVAAALIVDYLAAARTALGGAMPTMDNIVIERFFDDAGGQQLVVHAPFGARLNRALGMGLRKKFCVNFDFELQAAASDDAVLISLGPQHSFPLEDVPAFLKPGTAEAAVSQAVLQSPMFQARWRWNLNRSLAVLRRKGGRINPFNIQRMEAADLMVSCFPALAACQDNAPAGPIELPDHVLVRETMRDCLHEAMDIDGLIALTRRFEDRTIGLHCIETVEASPLTHEILNGAPYTYLDDDNEIGERRSRAVPLPRGLPVEARELGKLDPDAIARVRDEARPAPRDPDELHDLLLSRVVMRPDDDLVDAFEPLRLAGRAMAVQTRPVDAGAGELWCATERRPLAEAMFPGARFLPDNPWPSPDAVGELIDRAPAATIRGLLDVSGPLTVGDIEAETGLKESTIKIALAALQGVGFAVVGRFDHTIPQASGDQWCAKRLLARIHAYTRNTRRASVQAMSQEDWFAFIERHWHAAPGTKRHGRAGVAEVIEQLQGFEWPAGEWENVFAQRVEAYRPEWLDDLCMSGEVAWGRLSVVEAAAERVGDDEPAAPRRSGKTPSRRTPITFMVRDDLPWLLAAHRGDTTPAEPTAGSGRDILDALATRGALFHTELQQMTGRLPTEVEEGLWDGVARGLVTADGFNAVRALFNARTKFARRQRAHPGSRGRRGTWRHGVEGRWTLFLAPTAHPGPELDATELAEKVAWQLLHRWGIVFRDVYLKEKLAVPWREILWGLRRLEARGLILGGHFVTGVTGEQYALEEAVRASRRFRTQDRVAREAAS